MLSLTKFDYLIKKHKSKIFSYALYMLRNRMDAEDIAQEVMIRTWENINKFKFSSANAWIMRTTHNLCIDYLRRNTQANRREMQIDVDHPIAIQDQSTEANPEKETEKRLTDVRIKEAIRKLPERLKSPFVLYEVQGFKYKEISKILDVPLNTVKVNLLRARKLLQTELKEYKYNEVTRDQSKTA